MHDDSVDFPIANSTKRMTAPVRIFTDLIERARAVRIEDEVARRNIKLRGQNDRCGPCPRCGGTDRFSVNTRKQCWNCRGCALGGDVIALVQHLDGCNFTAAIETLTGQSRPIAARAVPPPAKTDEEYERQQHAKAAWLWSQRRPIVGIGRPSGCPIALAPPNDLLGLVIAEGIEDALSAREATGLGAWAAGSASFMPALAATIPSYIESLSILVDDNAAGWKNSTALRDGLLARREGLEIKLIRSAPDGL
jgi:hypothetical protein